MALVFLVLSGLCCGQAGARSRPAAGLAAPGTGGGEAHSAFDSAHRLPGVTALYRGRALCADDCGGRRLLRVSLYRRPRAGLLVADVSGHGVPAALIASMVKMATTAQRQHAASPERLLAGVNEALCGSTQGQFVTAAYVYLDAERGELCYAAAGHPPMLLLRDGQVCSIEKNGLVLGVLSSAAYRATNKLWSKGTVCCCTPMESSRPRMAGGRVRSGAAR